MEECASCKELNCTCHTEDVQTHFREYHHQLAAWLPHHCSTESRFEAACHLDHQRDSFERILTYTYRTTPQMRANSHPPLHVVTIHIQEFEYLPRRKRVKKRRLFLLSYVTLSPGLQ